MTGYGSLIHTINSSSFIAIYFSRMIDIVGVHAEGEVGDVIVGRILRVPDLTMYDKLIHLGDHQSKARS